MNRSRSIATRTVERRLESVAAAHDRRLHLVATQLVPGSYTQPSRVAHRRSRLGLAVQSWLAGGQL